MEVVIVGKSDFDVSETVNGLVKEWSVLSYPPNTSIGEKGHLLDMSIHSFDHARAFLFLSRYTRMILRVSGSQLLLNHDGSAHSQLIKPVR